ncbi:ABC transporter ATP-binding protein [Cryobacterium sp. 1639]|uniref:ABC transporter ATP-binding protein n=1 Tax=Cryobacterium inferilacus TaxID=2866629 RepID=UPI001C72F1F8|nr:ABC transporter ATP-binding protein [Cryobacterium sp. 1639]MBX0301900.1 ABC transporter ATP-binding protein [Cryobacterium sp. 1639]
MIIEVNDLRKSFGSNAAVAGVTFDVAEGDAIGLLGPNGAGKSTTISMLLGLVKPDGGSVSVFGEDTRRLSAKTRASIGFVPQELAFFPELSGLANVTYWGKLYGLRGGELSAAVREALEFTGLWDRRKEAAKNYSGGMQRRLNISCGIVHKPRILIMDEPTVGVDPQSRNHILESVRALRAGGSTIIYTSHYMEEIQAVCDRVVIMDDGRVVADGDIDAVVDEHTLERIVLLELETPEQAAADADRVLAAGIAAFDKIELEESTVTLRLDPARRFADVAKDVFALGLNLVSISEKRPTLETVFLSLTGRTLRD